MYRFKAVERAKVLQGRTVTYLAEKKIFCNRSYLAQILSGKKPCSAKLARAITNCISWEAKIDDYFEKEGE